MSQYIENLISKENRSVWIAQREGRTKDGNDATHQGVLKMLAMASENETTMQFFKKIRIVPVSISYEYDPTDALKIPQLMAKANDEVYIKDKNEDFITLLSGIIGQKKHIHIHVGDVLENELDVIEATSESANKQLQALAQVIDDSILQSYKLWPTNFIAYDMLFETDRYASKYTNEEKQLFLRRFELKLDKENDTIREGFLAMYANPVVNKLKYQDVK
jgi:hypothetical protein